MGIAFYMKIIVAVKCVVDFNVKIRVKADNSGVETANVKMSMNPFDEIAVEEAVRLKEKNIVDEVIVVSIGTDAAQETCRVALAMGADRALLVKMQSHVEPLTVAKIMSEIVQQESPQLVIMGKQAIDDDCNQTGQMLAGLLGWPQATFASKITIENAQAEVVREVDAGLETIVVDLPAVITTDLRLNTPRYISLPNIMKAKQKPLTIKGEEDFSVDMTSRLQIVKVESPPQKKAGIMVNSVGELVKKLHDEEGIL